jgi:hypothetical protein
MVAMAQQATCRVRKLVGPREVKRLHIDTTLKRPTRPPALTGLPVTGYRPTAERRF